MELCLAVYKPYCTMDDGNGFRLVKVFLDETEAIKYLNVNEDCIVKVMRLESLDV